MRVVAYLVLYSLSYPRSSAQSAVKLFWNDLNSYFERILNLSLRCGGVDVFADYFVGGFRDIIIQNGIEFCEFRLKNIIRKRLMIENTEINSRVMI